MHIHPNQINPNAQLDALNATDKAEAKREAERTRRKLMESASEIAGEAESGEDCVVQLGADEGRQKQEKQNHPSRKKKEPVDTEDKDNSISDWA